MRWRRGMAVILTLGLLAAACGDRGEDDSGSDSAGPDATDEGGEAANGDFGDLDAVCGPNEEGGAVTDDGTETQGVDDDTIKVGTVADPGFEGRPGLNQEIFDSGEAFVAWCNEAGGINGKQLELTLYDAAITEYQPQIEAACENEFAMVGGGAVQDNLWPTVGAECGLIDVTGFSVTPEKAGRAGDDLLVTRAVQPLPNPADRQIVAAAAVLAEEFPDAGDNSGILYGDLQTLITQRDKEQEAFESLGNTFVYDATYNILGEANWAPFAAEIQGNDVSWLRLVGEGENFALLQQALFEVGYEPEVTLQGPNFYDQGYVDAAGDAAEGTFVSTAFWPFEEAAENNATQAYLDLLDASGGKVALLGAQSMSGWLLFATAVKECDTADDLTRTCVLETAAAVEEWTAGGLHAPTSPAANVGAACEIVLRVEDGGFVRHAPLDEDFACDDDYLVEVEAGSSG